MFFKTFRLQGLLLNYHNHKHNLKPILFFKSFRLYDLFLNLLCTQNLASNISGGALKISKGDSMSMIPRQLLRIFQLTCLRQKFGHFEKSILFTFIRPKHLNLNTDFSKKNVLQTLLVNAKLQSVPLSLLQLKILKKIGALCIQQQSGGLHFKKNRSLFYF